MTPAELLSDAFDRVRQQVHAVVEGQSVEQLAARPAAGANTIAWLVWHLTRIQDDHVAAVAGHGQVWTSAAWVERFGLPFDPGATGYGQSSDEVDAVRPEGDLLLGYHDAVHAATLAFLKHVDGEALDRVVDTRWDPPVTLGARLVSVIADDLQHVGQAAYVRGLLEGG